MFSANGDSLWLGGPGSGTYGTGQKSAVMLSGSVHSLVIKSSMVEHSSICLGQVFEQQSREKKRHGNDQTGCEDRVMKCSEQFPVKPLPFLDPSNRVAFCVV